MKTPETTLNGDIDAQQIWDDERTLFMIKNDFAISPQAPKGMISIYRNQKIDETELWDYLKEVGFRSFTDHAKHWKAQLDLKSIDLLQLVEQLDELAQEGNQAISNHDLEAIEKIISKFEAIIENL